MNDATPVRPGAEDERPTHSDDNQPPTVPAWLQRLVVPLFWTILVALVVGQGLAFYGAGATTRRLPGSVVEWPFDPHFTQAPIGWVLLASLVLQSQTHQRPRLARAALGAGVVALAGYIAASLWLRPDSTGWWAIWLILGVIVHVAALLVLGAVAFEHRPRPETDSRLGDASPEPPLSPTGPPTVWQADSASGRVWTRAGDAATGAGPSHVGQPTASQPRELGPTGRPTEPARQVSSPQPNPQAGRMFGPGSFGPAAQAVRPASAPSGPTPLPRRGSDEPGGQATPSAPHRPSHASSPTRPAPTWERSGSPWPKRDESDPNGTLLRPPASPYHPPTPQRP